MRKLPRFTMYLTTQVSLFYFFVETVFGLVVLEFIGFVCLFVCVGLGLACWGFFA